MNTEKHGLELACCERRNNKIADIEIKTKVNEPVEDVFKLVADIPNYAKWVSQISTIFIDTKISPAVPG
jgi:uncharacterized membrane protein